MSSYVLGEVKKLHSFISNHYGYRQTKDLGRGDSTPTPMALGVKKTFCKECGKITLGSEEDEKH